MFLWFVFCILYRKLSGLLMLDVVQLITIFLLKKKASTFHSRMNNGFVSCKNRLLHGILFAIFPNLHVKNHYFIYFVYIDHAYFIQKLFNCEMRPIIFESFKSHSFHYIAVIKIKQISNGFIFNQQKKINFIHLTKRPFIHIYVFHICIHSIRIQFIYSQVLYVNTFEIALLLADINHRHPPIYIVYNIY